MIRISVGFELKASHTANLVQDLGKTYQLWCPGFALVVIGHDLESKSSSHKYDSYDHIEYHSQDNSD